MLIGELVLGGSNPQYSPPFARGGYKGTFIFNVLANVGGGTLTAVIETKDVKDATWSTTLWTFTGTTTTGLNIKQDLTGCMELYRWKFTLTTNSSIVRLNILPVTWEDTPPPA